MKKFLVFLSAFNEINSQYMVTMKYPETSCVGNPSVITSQMTQCTVASQGKKCDTADILSSAVFQSVSTQCSSDPINLEGNSQLYVSKLVYTTSTDCTGPVFSAEIVVADATCHPYSSDRNGVVNQYISVNCNGNKPIYTTCSDSDCSKNCQTIKYDNQCQLTGASTSLSVKCQYPSNWNSMNQGGGNGGFFDSSSSELSTNLLKVLLNVSALFYLVNY